MWIGPCEVLHKCLKAPSTWWPCQWHVKNHERVSQFWSGRIPNWIKMNAASAWNATFRKADFELTHRLEGCFLGWRWRVGCKRWHAARQSPLFCLEWGHCELTAQGSDFLSNKQIKPQICCRCTLTGEIHFQSDIQAGRTGNHNELFPRRSLCAGATSPRCLPGSWNNYNSCSRVLSLERRALAEMTGDVGVIFSGECCWKSLWCGWMGWWPG